MCTYESKERLREDEIKRLKCLGCKCKISTHILLLSLLKDFIF